MRKEVMEVENGINPNSSDLFDDDGRLKRTGTVWTASAHIITGVIGAGVLSLAWAMAQLGWFLGIISILLFSAITLYTSILLADCYRSPHPVTGKRNTTYMDAVQVHLGGKMHVYCGVVQYGVLAGYGIGYTITIALSVVTILKNDCYAKNGIEASCRFSNNPYMIGVGIIEIILSQIPNFHDLAWLSILAAIMSFGYSLIGVGLSLATVIQGKGVKTYLFWNTHEHISGDDVWNKLAALGNIALASAIAQISIDIQDSLKSSPAENKVMKKANVLGMSTMALVFLLCACSGYAAFGSHTPSNILMSTGFRNPLWLVDSANVFIIIHLIGAYQLKY
ncbi:PREDICTED: amino acid permease 1-like isoform X2 [Lupinus angustifolius]|uniref:amino acid permease 1-like isoform X2 n=1 Tax=Lupinus angustifolius TaxID=3871 RepID=UPI00092F6065|nr:PREDICTED: amino acid permease 1-like isoform X2 [Lupinus angustifolius]